ncbi:MAG TPA: hypothetical protein VJR23_05940 [Candidatus Acidoferrales bacterium]|nr:hypothetical protein [Candidatus Acidoferrales bacterium]
MQTVFNSKPISKSDASARVLAEVVEKCDHLANSVSIRPEAIVLAGSFARGEGSVLEFDNRLQVLGDMEFMVFYPAGTNLDEMQIELNQFAREYRLELAPFVDCELEFSAVAPDYLRKLRPQIFGFELLTHGRTVWGDKRILEDAPRFPASRIPRFDAWRMLNNRLLEQLEWADSIQQGDRRQLLRIVYQLAKCYMDLGTAVLLFTGRYESTYAGRANAVAQLASERTEREMWFLHPLAKLLKECNAFKLNPSLTAETLGIRMDAADLEEVRADICNAVTEMVPVARSIWRWAAAQISRRELKPETNDAELRDAALSTQVMREKLRGWVKVALNAKARREPAFARRMASLISRGSPRYLTYCVASELFFQLPAVLAGGDPNISAERLLPVKFTEHADEPRAWWRLRAEVLRGWRLYLRNQWA